MKQYVVDAFAETLFCGNPAAVCVMDKWISDELMMKIARENNLSETAFAVAEGDAYRLRWFTPGSEVDLCGHATLACGFVILNEYEKSLNSVSFETMSGRLTVERKNDIYELDFPAYTLTKTDVTEDIIDAVGAAPTEAYLGRDLLCVFDSEQTVRTLSPDLDKLMKIDGLILHATARGSDYDCVSRSFAPKLKVNEDPVCGSGHCHIVPYWSGVLGKNDICAYQASERGGVLYCRLDGDRVHIGGKAVMFSAAEIFV